VWLVGGGTFGRRAVSPARHPHDGRSQHPYNIHEVTLKLKKEAGSAALLRLCCGAAGGLDARHRPVNPRPHGAFTVCGREVSCV
jgi:hypothetical protein